MKKVYVYAYLAGNLGDDLFVRLLCRRYPRTRFCIFAEPVYKERFGDLPNCRVYSPEDREVKRVERLFPGLGFPAYLARRCQASVHIGGSVFVQHQEDWSGAYAADAGLAKRSRRLYVIGANFGPYTDPAYYEKYRELFCAYEGICFRDRYSYELFRDLPRVSWAPDVVFNLHPASLPNEKKVLISPIELGDRKGKYDLSGYEPAYREFHIRMIRTLLNRGYKITMVSFCQAQQDDTMMQKILDGLQEEERRKIVCTAYQTDMRFILQEFASSEAVLGTRFHSVILGLVHGCRVLPVIYDQKTEKTLEDLPPMQKLTLAELAGTDTEKTAEEWLSGEPMDIAELRRAAEGQFRYTDEFLK